MITVRTFAPKLEISPRIAVNGDEGKRNLPIKVLNARKWRDAFDIKAELVRIRFAKRAGGAQRISRKFDLIRSDPLLLERTRAGEDRCSFTFVTAGTDRNWRMIEEFYSPSFDCYIELRVVVGDGWSRVKKTFRSRYELPHGLRMADFLRTDHLISKPYLRLTGPISRHLKITSSKAAFALCKSFTSKVRRHKSRQSKCTGRTRSF